MITKLADLPVQVGDIVIFDNTIYNVAIVDDFRENDADL